MSEKDELGIERAKQEGPFVVKRVKDDYAAAMKRHEARQEMFRVTTPPIPPNSEYFEARGPVIYVTVATGETFPIWEIPKEWKPWVAALAMVEWNERWQQEVTLEEALKLNKIIEHWKIWRELE